MNAPAGVRTLKKRGGAHSRFNTGWAAVLDKLGELKEQKRREMEAAALAGGAAAGTALADSAGLGLIGGISIFEHATLFLESPASSRYAYVWSMFMAATTVLAITNFVVSTMNSAQPYSNTFFQIECLVTSVFTLEYVARAATYPDRGDFFFSIFNTIDLFALLPLYIDLMVVGIAPLYPSSDITQLTSFRIFRLSRLLKLAKSYSGMQVFILALERSRKAFLMLLFFLSFGIVFFSTLLWFTESPSGSPFFVSIPVSFWWGIVTFGELGVRRP